VVELRDYMVEFCFLVANTSQAELMCAEGQHKCCQALQGFVL
jgi:hypothetical protein